MTEKEVRRVVILGGGTAGWMTAAALAHHLKENQVSITLIESDQIGTVGVGEATIPHIRYFNNKLGINENEFMRRTNATYKLGIELNDWGKLGDSYIHPFGDYGKRTGNIPFHQLWLAMRAQGDPSSIEDYSVSICAARQQKFAYPNSNPNSLLSTYSYAFHMDATLYAQYLREYSEQRHVKRIEGKALTIGNDEFGNIHSIQLESGAIVEGDLFIDCSGFRAVLMEGNLKTGFDDWSHWLPCDRAIAVPTESTSEPLPYTKATAQKAGWQWEIPLQNRVGNGHVYCSEYMSDDEAADTLTKNVRGNSLANLNYLKFRTGRRQKSWNKNCIAVGLSSGFLEPLESTSIYLIQLAIMKIIDFFPSHTGETKAAEEFNQQLSSEYERVRDFLILHYKATQRTDSEFWLRCQNLDCPESLQNALDLYAEQGHITTFKHGLFRPPSWVALFTGQNIFPRNLSPQTKRLDEQALKKQLQALKTAIDSEVATLTTHTQAIEENCKNNSGKSWPEAALSLYGVLS